MLSEIKINMPVYEHNLEMRSQCPFCKQVSMFKEKVSSSDGISVEAKINCCHLRIIIRSEDNRIENTIIQYVKKKEIVYE
jgi:hypothetical protein